MRRTRGNPIQQKKVVEEPYSLDKYAHDASKTETPIEENEESKEATGTDCVIKVSASPYTRGNCDGRIFVSRASLESCERILKTYVTPSLKSAPWYGENGQAKIISVPVYKEGPDDYVFKCMVAVRGERAKHLVLFVMKMIQPKSNEDKEKGAFVQLQEIPYQLLEDVRVEILESEGSDGIIKVSKVL